MSSTLSGVRHSQSRIEATRHRGTRTGESGLSCGVVLHMELKGNAVSWLGSDGVGLERENASTTDDNTVIRTGGGRIRGD